MKRRRLINSIEPEISSSLIFLSTAKEVWDHVHKLFEKGNDARIYQLKQQIATMKQGDSSVTSFYTSLRTLWEELAFYQPLSTCSCGVMQRWLCDFDFVAEIEKDKVFHLLAGLRHEFEYIKIKIFGNDSLRSINKVLPILLNE